MGCDPCRERESQEDSAQISRFCFRRKARTEKAPDQRRWQESDGRRSEAEVGCGEGAKICTCFQESDSGRRCVTRQQTLAPVLLGGSAQNYANPPAVEPFSGAGGKHRVLGARCPTQLA